MKCKHKKPDGTICTANAMHDSEYCVFHNPEISDEERFSIRSEAHKSSSHSRLPLGEEGWGGGVSLPEMPMNNLREVANVLADTINQVRARKISQKSGTSIAYMSFVLYMIMKEAKAEEKNDEIAKQKAEGTYRPEPDYEQKHYTYKDSYYLDKDGNELIVENNGTSIFNPRNFQIESQCGPFIPVYKKEKRKRKKGVIPPLEQRVKEIVNNTLNNSPVEVTENEMNEQVLKTAKSMGLVDSS